MRERGGRRTQQEWGVLALHVSRPTVWSPVPQNKVTPNKQKQNQNKNPGAFLTAGQAFCALPVPYTQRPGGRRRLCLHKPDSSALQPQGSSAGFQGPDLRCGLEGSLDSGGQPHEKQDASLVGQTATDGPSCVLGGNEGPEGGEGSGQRERQTDKHDSNSMPGRQTRGQL